MNINRRTGLNRPDRRRAGWSLCLLVHSESRRFIVGAPNS